MYKHILFDLDNTIWDFETNSKQSLQEVYGIYQLDASFDSFDHFYGLYKERNHQLWAAYSQKQISKKYLNNERFFYPLNEVGIKNKDLADEIGAEYLTICANKTALMPYAKELLDYLAGKYKMHILSNGFAEVQYHKLKNSNLDTYFDRVILSEQVGVLKPDKHIFNFAVTSLNSRKKEIVMIGDNFKADIIGAKNAGIDQIYYSLEEDEKLEFQPTFVVRSLRDIIDVL